MGVMDMGGHGGRHGIVSAKHIDMSGGKWEAGISLFMVHYTHNFLCYDHHCY